MKKSLSILIAILFIYNSVGYLIAFKSLQYGIKKEIKSKILGNLDEKELVLIKFLSHPDQQQYKLFHWKEENEFEYNGNMFDVVKQYSVNDTIYYYCINDLKENELFGNLNVQVDQNMASSTMANNLIKLFKLTVDQSYLFSFSIDNLVQASKATYCSCITPGLLPVQQEIDTPPPEIA